MRHGLGGTLHAECTSHVIGSIPIENNVTMHDLIYTCVLTRDIERLAPFYREVLQLEPRSRGAYIEFPTHPGIFSRWSFTEYEQFVGITTAVFPETGSVMLEFQVENVDSEYARLRGTAHLAIEFVLPPTSLPWGNRSIYFRDPDGNLINFFTPIG
jgi:catechol 2,3-dioxygenase-like lactoylglutathione lyase family enzyme